MNKKLITPTIAIIAVLAAVWLYDSPTWEYKKMHGNTQGTTYNITYKYKADTDLQPAIEELLDSFDASLSTYEPNSIISKINRNENDLETDSLFRYVFQTAQEISKQTDGAFDITVGPLVKAWGFDYGNYNAVDSTTINNILQSVGMEKVTLVNNQIIKHDPYVTLDVNAIAQGYSVDVVAAFLDSKKIKHYLVEIGGELRCKGLSPKERGWRVGIDKPIDGNMVLGKELQAIIELSDQSLATSGNYRKFFEKDGIKYTHSIDPKTGYPVLNRLLSATVLSNECIVADAYATAFMVMGVDKSVEFLEKNNFLEAYLIYSDDSGSYQTYTTPRIKDLLVGE